MKKQVFDRYFDDFGGEQLSAQRQLRFTQEDIDNAERVGRAQGYSQGLEQGFVQGELKAISEHQKHVFQVSQNILNEMHNISKITQNQENQLLSYVIDLSRAILNKLLPTLAKQNALNQVEMTVKEVVAAMIEPTQITLFVHPDVVADIQDRLKNLIEEYKECIAIQTDTALMISDCSLTWKGGGAKLSQGNIQQQIDDIFLKHQPTIQHLASTNQTYPKDSLNQQDVNLELSESNLKFINNEEEV